MLKTVLTDVLDQNPGSVKRPNNFTDVAVLFMVSLAQHDVNPVNKVV